MTSEDVARLAAHAGLPLAEDRCAAVAEVYDDALAAAFAKLAAADVAGRAPAVQFSAEAAA